MTEPDRPALGDLLERLRFALTEPVDFTRSDSDITAANVRLLTAAATYFNVLAVAEFGGRPGPERQRGLLEQVVAAAFQTYGGIDPHPSPFDKAAMLLRGITRGHPFVDANKRTGFLVATFYLKRVGYVVRTDVSRQEVVSFCRRVSAGEIRELTTISTTLIAWTEPRRRALGSQQPS